MTQPDDNVVTTTSRVYRILFIDGRVLEFVVEVRLAFCWLCRVDICSVFLRSEIQVEYEKVNFWPTRGSVWVLEMSWHKMWLCIICHDVKPVVHLLVLIKYLSNIINFI